jgi:U3 small nucleolar RNA-associated protein 19
MYVLLNHCSPAPSPSPSSHRVQFFKLADAFLASGLVPAYSAAAFAKRFARLALSAPPAGAMLCIAFVHNIIRRHPSCMVLLHKPLKGRGAAGGAGGGGAGQGEPLLLDMEEPQPAKAAAAAVDPGQAGPGADPYDETQPDPAASRAVESSLWELEALRCHACPQVSTFVSVLDKDLGNRARTAEVDLGPLLPASTSALITTELGRRLKSAPLAFYAQQPSSVWGAKWEAQGLASRTEAEDGASSLEDLPGWDLGST